MTTLPHLTAIGCLLLIAAPLLIVIVIASTALTCSEGGECPAWSSSAGAGALFVTSAAFIGLVLVYGVAERIMTRGRVHPLVVALVVLLGLYALLVSGARFISVP